MQESIVGDIFWVERLGFLVRIIFLWGFFWEGEKKARVWRVKKRGILERYTSITYFLYFLGKNREKVSSGEWFDVRSLLLPLLLLLFLTFVFLCRWKSFVDGGIHNLSLISFRQRWYNPIRQFDCLFTLPMIWDKRGLFLVIIFFI